MKQRSIRDNLTDGFEPSPVPPVGPDGNVHLPQLRTPTRRAPTLCELGPCVHYQCMRVQMDAAAPQDGSDGGLHTETAHTCYPSPGVELDLGPMPVLECSYWEPQSPKRTKTLKDSRDRVLKTKQGRAFAAELRDWEACKADAERQAMEVAEEERKAEAATAPPPAPADDNDDFNPFGGAS